MSFNAHIRASWSHMTPPKGCPQFFLGTIELGHLRHGRITGLKPNRRHNLAEYTQC